MTIQEILDLGKMGYTKDDIEKMSGSEKEEPEKAEPEKAEPEKKEPEKAEPEKKEPEKADVSNAAGIDQLTESINALIKSIQAGNIIKSNNHSGEDESAEEILGSIIMPPLKKGEKTK